MNKQPHKHADLIKAWADGAEVDYLDEKTLRWVEESNPSWHPAVKYRLRPKVKQPVVRHQYAFLHANLNWYTNPRFLSEEEMEIEANQHSVLGSIRLDFTRTEFPE